MTEPNINEVVRRLKQGRGCPHVVCAKCGGVFYSSGEPISCPACDTKPFEYAHLCPHCGSHRTDLIRDDWWLCFNCEVVFENYPIPPIDF